jgi:hypothetical protein
MPSRHPHPTTPWQFCVSCVSALIFCALWLVLAGLLALQCYFAVGRDLSVPPFILRRLEAQLAAEDLQVRFGRAHFDASGRVVLENGELRSKAFEEPLLSSRYIFIHKSLWSILADQHMPDDVRVEGAVLQLPAMLSPSGQAEPLLHDLAGEFHFVGRECTIRELEAQIGNLGVSITGTVISPRGARGTPLTLAEILERFLQYGRRAALELPKLQAAEHPSLTLTLNPRSTGGTNVLLQFTTEGLHQPENLPFDLGPVSITGDWIWDGANPHALNLKLAVRSLAGPHDVSATNVRADLNLEPGVESASFSVIQAKLAADDVQAFGEQFASPFASGTYSLRDRQTDFAAHWLSHGELLAVNGTANLIHDSARIALAGRISPALVTGLLTRHGPKLEPYFRLGDPVDLEAALTVADGWKFAGLDSRVRGGRLDSRGVMITSLRGRIEVDADLNFLAHDALVVAGENEARGSYWMNFRSHDYRMLLAGSLRPPDIGGWFRGKWWLNFWDSFSFPVAPPRADVDVAGRWTEARLTTYFGSSDAVGARVLGGDFEHVHAVVFDRPQYAHVMNLAVDRADGAQHASGWFDRWAEGPGRSARWNYDLTGNLDPSVYLTMASLKTSFPLESVTFAQPPQLHAWGSSEFGGGKPDHDMHFTARTDSPLTLADFPLERVSVAGSLLHDSLRLDPIEFSFAGGAGDGRLTLEDEADRKKLGVDLRLKGANLARTLTILEKFAVAKPGKQPDSKFIKRADAGKLDLSGSVQGNPAVPAEMRGEGSFQISGAVLGEVRLFGALSQALSAVALNFSSLKLDAARSNFQLGNGRLHFPDMKITGPSALIEARGDYLLAGKSLDFTAKLKPYQESHNPIANVVGIVIDPIASIFELKLTGPLSKPSWSVSLGSSPNKATVPTLAPVPAPVPVPEIPVVPGAAPAK